MMKKILVIVLVLMTFKSLNAQLDCRATVTSDGTTIRAFIKPFTAPVAWPAGSTIQLLVVFSLPANGATNTTNAPIPTSATTTLGGNPSLTTLFVANDRYNYSYQFLTNTAPAVNWVAGSENLAMSLTFTSVVDGIYPRLDNLVNSGGGPGGTNYFYFETPTGQRSDTEADPFYDGLEGSYPSSDQYVQALSPLPIKLLSFDAEKNQERNVLLNWITSNEINSSHFLIQRSSDKKFWSTVGRVNAAGNSQLIENYEFLDLNVYNGIDARMSVYYRLQMVDLDGQAKASPIENVVFGNSSTTAREFLVYPNPASDGVQIEWDANQDVQPTALEFYDVAGKLVYRQKVSDNTNQEYVDFGRSNIQTGLYLLRIMNGTEAIEHKQIVVGQNR